MALRLYVFSRYLSFLFHFSRGYVKVRDFIHAELYDPKHGYFSQRSRSVGVLENSIRFNQLEEMVASIARETLTGRFLAEHRLSCFTTKAKSLLQLLVKVHKQSEVSWFTTVKLFKIYEIGGGSGTCAKEIMDYLQFNASTVTKTITRTK